MYAYIVYIYKILFLILNISLVYYSEF